MDEQIFFRDATAELHDLEIEPVQPNALVAILPKNERLAVLELHHVLAACIFLRKLEPRAIIENIAVLQDFNVRRSLVRCRLLQRFFQVTLKHVN